MNKTFVLIALTALGLSYSMLANAKDYSYFMTHPAALEKAYEKCKEASLTECDSISKAVGDFQQLVAERQENAQDFGKRILASESALALLQQKLEATSATSVDYIDLLHDVDQKQQEVEMLLAVVGATSMLE